MARFATKVPKLNEQENGFQDKPRSHKSNLLGTPTAAYPIQPKAETGESADQIKSEPEGTEGTVLLETSLNKPVLQMEPERQIIPMIPPNPNSPALQMEPQEMKDNGAENMVQLMPEIQKQDDPDKWSERTIMQGETLWSIGRELQIQYGLEGQTSAADIAKIIEVENNISDVTDIPAGTPLRIPTLTYFANTEVEETPALSVDRIDVIFSSTGAVTGYGGISGDADLNTPGPFNTATEIKNVHQIKFHLDNGDSADLTDDRVVKASWAYEAGSTSERGGDKPEDTLTETGGFSGTLPHTDDNSSTGHETLKPDANTIVIADAPGGRGLSASSYPYTFDGDFILDVKDSSGTVIARITYEVHIDKQSASENPATTNSITVNSKKDLVRNIDL